MCLWGVWSHVCLFLQITLPIALPDATASCEELSNFSLNGTPLMIVPNHEQPISNLNWPPKGWDGTMENGSIVLPPKTGSGRAFLCSFPQRAGVKQWAGYLSHLLKVVIQF